MKSTKPVIILPGQIYFDDEKNEYLIVQRRKGETISYSGHGFKGMLEDEVFLERFQPVDPVDLSAGELQGLIDLCPAGTTAKVGFIAD